MLDSISSSYAIVMQEEGIIRKVGRVGYPRRAEAEDMPCGAAFGACDSPSAHGRSRPSIHSLCAQMGGPSYCAVRTSSSLTGQLRPSVRPSHHCDELFMRRVCMGATAAVLLPS
jgi:hypothetical protein